MTCRDLKSLHYSVHAQTLRTTPHSLSPWVQKPSKELRPHLASIVEKSRFAGLGFPPAEKESIAQSQSASMTSNTTAIWEGRGQARTTCSAAPQSSLNGRTRFKGKRKRMECVFFFKEKKKQRIGAITSQQQGWLSLVRIDGIKVTSHCCCSFPKGVVHRCLVK